MGLRWPSIRWSLLPLLFVPVLLSLWRPNEEGLLIHRPTPPSMADYYIRDAKTSVMGTDGLLSYQVRAAEVTHYPDNSARMQQVRVHYKNTSQYAWQLTANRGYAPPRQSGEDERIELTDGVQILGERGANDAASSIASLTSIVTDKATIYPALSRLETQATVQIREPGLTADAEGLIADVRQGVLSLQGKVKVNYVQ